MEGVKFETNKEISHHPQKRRKKAGPRERAKKARMGEGS